MGVCLLGGDTTFVDQRLDESVVARDLCELAVAEEVAARVTDVGEPDPAAREQDRGQRRAHAVEVGGAFDLCGDGRVAAVGCAVEGGEQIAAGLVVVECA